MDVNHDLHIVSFNVPLPANYGGIIDVFYRLKALSAAGVRIHLHCFDYGRGEDRELERYCAEVHYYRRDMSPLRMLDRRPFIVSSRDSKELKSRLLQDNHPVLLEGLHCCALLEDDAFLQGRAVLVRAHNVETDYYGRLAKAERSFVRRLYLKLDASRISRYEPVLAKATVVLAVSDADRDRFLAMGCREVRVMSSCHPYDHVASLAGQGSYALYHGALDVAENQRAAEYLVEQVFAGTDSRLVVAGTNPGGRLRELVERHANVTLEASPGEERMQRLIAEAQVCVLVTDQPTGLKLKLLNSLFAGRHCLVNSHMVAGTDLGPLCTVADSVAAQREALEHLMITPFSEAMLEARRGRLQPRLPAEAVKPVLEWLR